MDLKRTIADLRAQRDKLEAVIQQLESLDGTSTIKLRSPRGRKSMDAEERRAVSARMKKYWASRRKSAG